jgi:hypothetical protein
MLMNDRITLVQGIEQAGGQVELKIWQDRLHCRQLYGPIWGESKQSIVELAQFVTAGTG